MHFWCKIFTCYKMLPVNRGESGHPTSLNPPLLTGTKMPKCKKMGTPKISSVEKFSTCRPRLFYELTRPLFTYTDDADAIQYPFNANLDRPLRRLQWVSIHET